MRVPSLSRRARRAGALTASTLALAGAAAALAPLTADAATPPACLSAQLVATVGDFQGGLGSFFGTLTLTNLGGRCTLQGYPGVSGVDVHGRQLGVAARRDAGRARTVTLGAATARGTSSAHARIGVASGLAYTHHCGARWAAGLRVYPPGQRAALAVPYVFRTCTTSRRLLSVGPLR